MLIKAIQSNSNLFVSVADSIPNKNSEPSLGKSSQTLIKPYGIRELIRALLKHLALITSYLLYVQFALITFPFADFFRASYAI